MYCINCGEEVVEPAKFCIACGASIYRQEDGRQRSEPAAAVSRVRANWFVKHWYGDLPLAQSFWVNGFILFFVFDFGEWVLESFFPISEISLVTLYRWYAGVYVVRIIAFVWQSVGCWRSAQRHLKRGGSILWPRAAQGLIFLGFLFTIVVVPVAVHLLGQVIGLGANSNYTLTISADGEELAVVGDMAFDLPDEVAELLEQETTISSVNL
ncbi:MAG TPA: zinc ribbon domain-containing protein, partial [Acidobacteria bacterium]|nr:zinc ribbon domain-containing protein [Acidobacteriota bacterium]